MRKFILPLLVAGAVAFTAAQAMATDSFSKGAFNENHANGTSFVAGYTSQYRAPNGAGNHYKATDVVEKGWHGDSKGGFQISSFFLKKLVSGSLDADDAYGYSTNVNPFVAGRAGGTLQTQSTDPDDVGYVLAAPAYTIPCPTWLETVGTESNGNNTALSIPSTATNTCPANALATVPQTMGGGIDNQAIWDGTVLDEIYQVVGVNDNSADIAFNSTNGDVKVGTRRMLDQTLDQLFYAGKRGTIQKAGGKTFANGKIGITTVPGNARIFNVEDTLDQDLADYTTGADETMGIFGKLTMIFQIAGRELTAGDMAALGFSTNLGLNGGDGESGCASWGGYGGDGTCTAWTAGLNGISDGGTGDDELLGGTTFYDMLQDPANGTDVWGQVNKDFTAVIIDQWVVSEMYDFHHDQQASAPDPKVQGTGVKQEYSSWFRDGTRNEYNYTYDYDGSHGTINKTVSLGDHGTLDP